MKKDKKVTNLIMFFNFLAVSSSRNMTGYVSDDMKIEIKEGIIDKNGTCWAIWTDTLDENGLTHYNVSGREGETVGKMMYCAGYLEGIMAQTRIYQAFKNNREVMGYDRFPQLLTDHYSKNVDYMRESIESNPESVYWRGIGGFFNLAQGMIDGYSTVAPEDQKIDPVEFRIHQSFADMWDILTAFNQLDPLSSIRAKCTAGIRLLPDFSDIFVFHNSWSDYRNMLGSVIDYDFPVPEFYARHVTFTTCTGMIGSLDDFYFSDTGLIVFETSLMSQDLNMLKSFITPKSLLCGYRAIYAMFTAHNGSEWTEIFLQHNSGTYNNDYFITDLNIFSRGEKPSKDLVWLVEQVPSPTHYTYDVTGNLTKDGFIASFNVPFNEDLYYLLQYDKVENSSEYYLPYKTHPRFLISARELPRIYDFEAFKKFSRFNKYKHDIYSRGDPMFAIASREDLMGKAPAGAFNQKAVAGSRAYTDGSFAFCNSPTDDDLPSFTWNCEEFKNISHTGIPDVLNFSWVTLEGRGYDFCETIKDQNVCQKSSYCGWCGRKNLCMAGNEDGPLLGKCPSGWHSKFTSFKYYIISIITVAALTLVGGFALAWIIYKKSRKPQDYDPLIQ